MQRTFLSGISHSSVRKAIRIQTPQQHLKNIFTMNIQKQLQATQTCGTVFSNTFPSRRQPIPISPTHRVICAGNDLACLWRFHHQEQLSGHFRTGRPDESLSGLPQTSFWVIPILTP
jgi:hypothetical protein